MSGEPKTLTLTLEEAMRAVHFERLPELRERHGYLADVQMEMTQSGWWVFLNNDGEENQIKEFDRWEDAASFALGVPVVARDEAAELRAAAVEWAEADHAAREAHKAWLSEAAKGGASYTGDKVISRSRKRWAESLPSFHAWVKASAERHAAKERLEALARRLAGGENER